MNASQDMRWLEAELARHVASTPGVAYLSPNLLQRLTRAGESSGGVRIRTGASTRVDVWIAVRADHQAAATARAVRDRVTAALSARPDLVDARVRVIVTATA